MKARTAVGGLLALLVLAGVAAAGAYAYAERWYRTPLSGLRETVVVEIAPGEPFARLAEALAKLGVVDHPRLYAWLARRDGRAARVQAGEYALAPGASPLALLEQFVEGRVVLHPVTLVEGWTAAQALESLHANPLLKRLVTSVTDPGLMAALGSPGFAAEGQFFPDTYRVAKGTSDLEVLKLAHTRLGERLADAWQRRRPDLPLAVPYEALILASIVEKETGDPEERPHIAAVFLNRLRQGMRLQTDPTVIYGLGSAYDGSLHHRDLEADTPYNTYTRAGLPPTPIALAGEAALAAAVQPADSADLYFVATGRGDGRHVFSRTLEEHNAAVQRYVGRLRAARRAR
ncbi:MAG: endolytic transglycosylase MltG [Proteobacteria bacterium]|nr:endolytic transglycosylase MltG [Pseudomonadota bacterium]